MIRLANAAITATSPEFSWPNQTGTTFTDFSFNHNLGVIPDAVEAMFTSASSTPNTHSSNFSHIAGTYYGYNVVVNNTSTTTLRCYRHSSTATPFYIIVFSHGGSHF